MRQSCICVSRFAKNWLHIFANSKKQLWGRPCAGNVALFELFEQARPCKCRGKGDHSLDEPMRVTGRVKWFDAAKGFGFIVADEGGPDILLHANVLRNYGQNTVAEDSRLEVEVVTTPRGRQVAAILHIEPAPAEPVTGPVANLEAGPLVPARIKWFDRVKGFGFANVYGHPEDVFVHMEVVRRGGLADLAPGEAVAVRVANGPRGKMAVELRSWDQVRAS